MHDDETFPSPVQKKPNYPRARANSTRIGGGLVEGPSPLAQIFQPLVVQDPVEEEDRTGRVVGPGLGPSAISYGPANRRRVPSMNQVGSAQRRPSSLMGASPGSMAAVLDEALRESPMPHERGQGWEEVPAEEVRADEEVEGGVVGVWTKRLEGMEERQKRIEEMLVRLVGESGMR
jgi:hypothetical protein